MKAVVEAQFVLHILPVLCTFCWFRFNFSFSVSHVDVDIHCTEWQIWYLESLKTARNLIGSMFLYAINAYRIRRKHSTPSLYVLLMFCSSIFVETTRVFMMSKMMTKQMGNLDLAINYFWFNTVASHPTLCIYFLAFVN